MTGCYQLQMLFSGTVKGGPALPFIPICRRTTAREMMITMRSTRLHVVAAVPMLAVSACGGHGADFPPPPRTAPVALSRPGARSRLVPLTTR